MTARSVLNIGNYIFTSNEENPIYLDKTDRRNHLIKTTDNSYWKEFAAVIQTKYVQVDIENIAAGFAWVLEQVQVDMQFVNTSFINNLKANIISESQNLVEEWLTHDPLIKKNVAINADDLYQKFKEWMRDANPDSQVISMKKFGTLLTNAGAGYGVKKDRNRFATTYEIGVAPVAVHVDRASVARDVGGITLETITVQDNDVAVVLPVAPVLTEMQRMRAMLQRMNAVQEHFGYDE